MKMTVIQPAYFMSVKALARVARSDVIVWAETFPFRKGTTINRMEIKTAEGGRWLSIPIKQKGRGRQRINQCEIDNHEPWIKQHWKNIENNYKNAPYYFYFEQRLKELFSKEWHFLNDLLVTSFEFLVHSLFPEKEIVFAGKLPQAEDRSVRVLKWAEATGADEYLLNEQETGLVNLSLLMDKGLSIFQYQYREMPYHQQFTGFISGLTGLDVLFNEGEMSSFIIKSGARLLSIDEV